MFLRVITANSANFLQLPHDHGETMPGPQETPEPATSVSGSFWAGAGLLGLLATLVLGFRLGADPAFVDEWAYISQAHFGDLWWEGKTDHTDWLEYPAYDLPPLPKYAIDLALRAAGHWPPRPGAAFAWYQDTSRHFGPNEMLVAARVPTVFFGAIGCVALYALGTLASGRRTGTLAALLLLINPLYALHARRAMSDVVAESLILLALAIGLWVWRSLYAGKAAAIVWIAAVAAGLSAGLATLAKLNGALAMITIAGWVGLALLLPRLATWRKAVIALAATVSGIVAATTFVAGNPFVTAHPRGTLPPTLETINAMSPWRRMAFLVQHRNSVADQQQIAFRHNALTTLSEKLATVTVQGFGRFGPFGPRHSDSTRRYDVAQDWGALIWLPCVLVGIAWAVVRGRAQWHLGHPPTAWAVLLAWVIALAAVTIYLPLAWDRYFLSLQAGSSLLVAGMACAVAGRLVRGKPRGLEGS
jgi:4-amino-4-deoxy-L-arabinose transferase-like glycosyltransferase